MAAAYLKKTQCVFDPFTTRMGRGGTGLGLGICHNIVTETLAGTINIESVLGAGTTVITRIPVAPPNSTNAATAWLS